MTSFASLLSNNAYTSKPTPKMVNFAKAIAFVKSIKVSEAVTTNFDECKKFLDENSGLNMPTDKMIRSVVDIAKEQKISYKADNCNRDFEWCRNFIEQNSSTKPSDKMLTTIRSIIEQKNIDTTTLDERILSDRSIAKAFISANL